MPKFVFYCAKCWQEFDRIKEHNTGSWLNGERLDGLCKGDIRLCKDKPKTVSEKPNPGSFDFDATEGIKIV